MKFIIVGRNIEVTPGLKTAVEDKIGKLEKYFTPETEVHGLQRLVFPDHQLDENAAFHHGRAHHARSAESRPHDDSVPARRRRAAGPASSAPGLIGNGQPRRGGSDTARLFSRSGMED